MPLVERDGMWVGSNGFRLMPSDPFYEAPAEAIVVIGAVGNLTSIAYAWSHPDDGEQSGLLVLGSDDEPGSALALWADSWHQSPAAKVLKGTMENGLAAVGYEYGGGWGWQITVEAQDGVSMSIRMDNVIPESAAEENAPAGAYPAMVATLSRV